MRECIMKRVQHEKCATGKRCNIKWVHKGRVKCKNWALWGKTAAKKGTMKRVKQETSQKWSSKLKKVQHKKIESRKACCMRRYAKEKWCNMKRAQYEKRCNMKRVQKRYSMKQCNTKRCDMKRMHDQKGSIVKVQDENTETWKKLNMKIVQLERTGILRYSNTEMLQHEATRKK